MASSKPSTGRIYTPQDNVKIIGNSKAAEIAKAKQILRRAVEEKPVDAKANARGLKAANKSTAVNLGGMQIKTPIIKTSGLGGREGKLGGQHAGGHAGH